MPGQHFFIGEAIFPVYHPVAHIIDIEAATVAPVVAAPTPHAPFPCASFFLLLACASSAFSVMVTAIGAGILDMANQRVDMKSAYLASLVGSVVNIIILLLLTLAKHRCKRDFTTGSSEIIGLCLSSMLSAPVGAVALNLDAKDMRIQVLLMQQVLGR